MASTTAEVLLYYGTDDEKFRQSVDKIRFSQDPPLEFKEILDVIHPIYCLGWDQSIDGDADGTD